MDRTIHLPAFYIVKVFQIYLLKEWNENTTMTKSNDAK